MIDTPARLVGLLLLALTLAACADGDSGSSPFGPHGSHLRVEVRDNPVGRRPVAGVYAILHGPDGVSVERTLVTGEDGAVDFGPLGRSEVTVTLAWKSEGLAYVEQELWTYVAVPAGDVTHYVSPWPRYDQDGLATVDVTASDAPPWTADLHVQPSSRATDRGTTIYSVAIRSDDLQTDGRLSLLVAASDSMMALPQDARQAYAFLLDQPVSDGATYTVPGASPEGAWRTPAALPWTAAGDERFQHVGLHGFRRGVRYDLGSWLSSTLEGGGTLPFREAFPADEYWVTAVSCEEGPRTCVMVTRRLDGAPSALVLDTPDYGVKAAEYDPSSRTLRWWFKAGTQADLVTVTPPGTIGPTHWSATLKPSATQWTLPDLPPPVSEWVGASPPSEVLVGVTDFQDVADFDALWETYRRQGLGPAWGEATVGGISVPLP